MTGLPSEENRDVEARLLRKLYELSSSAGGTLHPGELIRLVAEHACELLSGDAVALYLWDGAAGVMRPLFSNDPREPSDDYTLQPNEGAAGRAVRLRQPVVVEDYAAWDHAIPWVVELGLKSTEAVPLLLGDRPIGALMVRFYRERREFGPDDQQLLTVLAAQVAPAVEAARLYATSTQERQQERALREITQALAVNLDERNVLDLAVRYGAALLQAPYARVWLLVPGGELVCAAAEGFIHAETFNRRLSRESTSGRVARQRIVNLADAPAEASWTFNREFGERTGLGAYLGAGLWRAGEPLGVLEVMRATGHRFSRSEEQLLASLANAVAVAVSNARTHAAAERFALEAGQRAEAVAESERLLRTIYEAMGSGVVVYDAAGRISNANAAAGEIRGYPREALLNERWSDLQTWVDTSGAVVREEDRPYSRALREREPLRKQVFGITRPDGGQRWVQVDAVPITTADGQVSRVIGSFIDITERIQSEEQLRQRDAILQAIASAAERVLTSADWHAGIDSVLAELGDAANVSRVYITPSVADGSDDGRHYQWTAESATPRPQPAPGADYLHSVGLGRWEMVLRGGGIIQGHLAEFPTGEREVLAAQGVCSIVVVPIFAGDVWWGFIGLDDCRDERAWPLSTVEVLRTAAGTIGAAIVGRRAEAARLQLAREQSARAEAEAAQHELAFLAEASQLLAISLDDEKTLQSVAELVVPNVADCCFVDIRDGDNSIRRVGSAVGDRFAAFVADPVGSRISATSDHPVASVIRSGEPRLATHMSQRFRERGGFAFDSAITVPLIGRTGTAGSMTWLGSTERASFGPRDLDLALDLARRCALAIENARLYREARAAVSLRDEFLSVAAHELKTPMTSLRGYAQLLGREFDRNESANPERARRAATTIQVQSDKLARLVAQLLDVSRIQSGKLVIERRTANLSALVREVVEASRNQLREHTLMARLPEELNIFVDPLRIEQVVTNLIDNAIKYSPDGGQIDVSLTAQPGEVAVLSVRDHGVGIPLEHREHVFDRFYQAHAGGPLTGMAGMGLGLYISRQIVEQHDGTIEAAFPPDGGTQILVKLPLGLAA
jgi:PAS domain S-box-containing protein